MNPATPSIFGVLIRYVPLLLVPVGLLMDQWHVNPQWVFVVTALAIIPLAQWMGTSTERVSEHYGTGVSSLLNASLGNGPEIIIGYFALKAGLVDVVKASITGSILANLLFGLGIALISSGLRHPNRFVRYDLDAFKVHGSLLLLAISGLIVPAMFDLSTGSEDEISLEISVILLLVYLVTLIMTFFPDRPRSDTDDALEIVHIEHEVDRSHPQWGRLQAISALIVFTGLLAYTSEVMTRAIEPTAQAMGQSPIFMGVFVLALLGNAAEFMVSIRFARTGQLQLAFAIFMGSSTQMALFVAPLLVFIGLHHGLDMNLLFSPYEIAALVMTVAVITSVLNTGKVKPGTGLILIALYVMLGVGFLTAKV